MKIGDVVKVTANDTIYGFRPPSGSVGIVVEIKQTPWLGTFYYVYINNVGWRFYEKEVERRGTAASLGV